MIRHDLDIYLFLMSCDPGEGPFPAVLDLSTFTSEKRGCLLASKGFVVLVLALFTGKPDKVQQLHLDHFKDAVDFLQRQPKVDCFYGPMCNFQAFPKAELSRT